MPLEHACFVSYAHDPDELMSRFIDEFVECLRSSLRPYVDADRPDRKVFIDRAREQPGYRIDETRARTMCESACWIMVYVRRTRTMPTVVVSSSPCSSCRSGGSIWETRWISATA